MAKEIKITKDTIIGLNQPPFIIAELGSNHNGDMALAKELIKSAKACGADCVKFQSWTDSSIFSRKVYEDNYFLQDDYRNRSDYTLKEIVTKYAISKDQLRDMKRFCEDIEIKFCSTPFSNDEVDFLVTELNVDFIKIASMDLNNYPFLEYVAKKAKPVVISTGLSTLAEIDRAINLLEENGNKDIIILHCISNYPPKDSEINLRNIETLEKLYPYPVGFSDHSIGTCIPLAAVAQNACLIEKHFTLDKDMEGWDHKVSASKEELKEICSGARRIFQALGTGRISRREEKDRCLAFRRSIVAARKIEVGELITSEMLNYKRPGSGLEPDATKFLVGKKAKRTIEFDDLISMDDF